MNESTLLTIVSVIMLISLLSNLLQSFWLSKSVPHELAKAIFDRAAELASRTASPDDDKIVNAARGAYDLLTQGEKPRD
jgi:uncharacterized Zn finger protein